MEDAQVQYDERDKQGLGFFRDTWRKLGRKANFERDIDPWLDLIPNDYGLCIVRGAIVLILMVGYSIPNTGSVLQAVLQEPKRRLI